MLIELIVMALDERNGKPENPAVVLARMSSLNTISNLVKIPGEVSRLKNQLSCVYASIPVNELYNWKKKLGMMPDCFSFGSNFVRYWQNSDGGILFVAECAMTPHWGSSTGNANTLPDILNVLFFATENTSSGVYEIRSFPTHHSNHKLAAQIFGSQFLEMMSALEVVVKRPPVPNIEEIKKPWWKTIFRRNN